jgi:hypothetical protein
LNESPLVGRVIIDVGHVIKNKSVRKVLDANGNVRCPTCGKNQFTLQATPMGLVIACWYEPTYLRFT